MRRATADLVSCVSAHEKFQARFFEEFAPDKYSVRFPKRILDKTFGHISVKNFFA